MEKATGGINMEEYKQAIIIGAAPMMEEKNRLLRILKWAGRVPLTEEEKKLANISDCDGTCKACKNACTRKEIVKDIFLIAADGGLEFLYQHNIKPDYFVGDMDSINMNFSWKDFIGDAAYAEVPVKKDDTDTALAVKKAYESGYKNMMLFGCSGGERLSHTIANIQLMLRYEMLGCHIRMIADSYQAEILVNKRQDYSKALKGKISVIALSDVAKNVHIKGLEYEYQGDLTNENALGISNSFIGEDAFVEVLDGKLLLIYESDKTD